MLPKFEELENKEIVVKLIKSLISTNDRQKANVKGLGLKGIGSESTLKCTRDIYGMLVKVSHLISVELKK